MRGKFSHTGTFTSREETIFNFFSFIILLQIFAQASASCTKTNTCVVKGWVEWSNCSASCGAGTRQRQRIICCDVQYKSLDSCLVGCNLTKQWWQRNGVDEQVCGICMNNGKFNKTLGGCLCRDGFGGKCCNVRMASSTAAATKIRHLSTVGWSTNLPGRITSAKKTTVSPTTNTTSSTTENIKHNSSKKRRMSTTKTTASPSSSSTNISITGNVKTSNLKLKPWMIGTIAAVSLLLLLACCLGLRYIFAFKQSDAKSKVEPIGSNLISK